MLYTLLIEGSIMSQPHQHIYARVSHPDQRKGGGLERQTAADAGEFGRRFGFVTAKRILVDDGVSAWKGLNTTPDHELGRFIADARRKLIPPGDCLLIENYDRLSRQNPWASISLVNDLRELGIHIGRLDRMKLLRCDSTDAGDFFEAAIELMRGHSESQMKSMRNGKAWEKKRARARGGTPMTRRLPLWIDAGPPLRLNANAEIVRTIFGWAAAGYGYSAIVKRLAERQVTWSRAFVVRILKDRRAVGELQPKRRDGTPEGEPISNYYPSVVGEDEWLAARAGAAERRRRPGRVDLHHPNPYAGILHNPIDGTNYFVATRVWKGKRTRVLFNGAGSEGRAPIRSFPYETFDRAFRALLREVNPAEVLGTDSGPDEVMVLTARHAELEARLAALEAELETGDVAAVAKVARKVEGDVRGVAAKLADARHRAAHPLSASWGETQTLLGAMEAAPDKAEAYTRLRTALRRIVEGIWLLVVPRGRDRLCAAQVWFKRDEGEVRSRSYLILHRHAGSGSGWRAGSLADVTGPADLDLRRREDAAALEEELAGQDAEALWEALEPEGGPGE
jgi:DNA invertase Pin-like site-specific DNA recombinase